MNTSTPSAIGVAVASSTVLSTTWPAASLDPCPGGRWGPKTKTTIGVMIALASSHSSATLRAS